MSHVSCDCTLIKFTLPTSPIDVYFCHCLECRKQSSSAFGCSAIFPASAIWPLPQTIQQHLSMWTRPSKTGGTMQCYFCNTCGSRIMHVTVKPDGGMSDYISVKGGVINGLDMSGAKHIYTRSAVVPVPDGCPGSPSET